jgi:hypothetical protein
MSTQLIKEDQSQSTGFFWSGTANEASLADWNVHNLSNRVVYETGTFKPPLDGSGFTAAV